VAIIRETQEVLLLTYFPETVRLVLCLDYLWEPGEWEYSSREGRVATQHSVYLIQVAGVPFGYRFREYPLGLYSGLVDEVLSSLHPEDVKQCRDCRHFFTHTARAKLDQVKPLMNAPVELQLADWLRLTTTLHYLLHIAYLPPSGKGKRDAIVRLLAEREDNGLLIDHLDAAWRSLDAVGLVRHKTLPCPEESPG